MEQQEDETHSVVESYKQIYRSKSTSVNRFYHDMDNNLKSTFTRSLKPAKTSWCYLIRYDDSPSASEVKVPDLCPCGLIPIYMRLIRISYLQSKLPQISIAVFTTQNQNSKDVRTRPSSTRRQSLRHGRRWHYCPRGFRKAKDHSFCSPTGSDQ